MKKLLTLVLIGLFLGIVPKVWAQGVGSPECLMVQLDAQAAVTAGGPYLRHGHLVRTAAAVVDAAVVAGDIDEECASCIMNQFARGIPIAEQPSLWVRIRRRVFQGGAVLGCRDLHHRR